MSKTNDVESHPPRTVESFSRHPKFYFEDGSIILDVECTLFRVHQSVLSRQSEVFRSMFSLIQPDDTPMVDGCPSVQLAGDSSKDVEEFLGTLYDPLCVNKSNLDCVRSSKTP